MKIRNKIIAFLLVSVIALSLFSACGAPTTETADSTAASTDANSTTEPTAEPVEQALNYGTDTWPAGFDPHTISAHAATRVFNQVYETLIGFNDDMSFRPLLAESWETPDDVTYVFTLREGVMFHNGREMTAEDVKYSFDRVLGNSEAGDIGALGNSASYYAGIASIEVLDTYSIQFTLAEPNAAFMSTLTSSYGAIVCKEVVDENDGSLSTIASMSGTGPFMYSESVVDNYITLVKNPNYWMDGAPSLDTINYYLMADESTRFSALQTGEINLTTLSAMNLSDAQSDENIAVISYQSNDYTFLGFNLSREALQDQNVRQAMSLAIDRAAIIDYVYNGEAVPTTFVPPAMGRWTWDAVSESPLYTQNIDEAKALMEAAGYSEDNRLTLTMAVGLLDSIRDTGTVIQQQLAEIYIDIETTDLESGAYVDQWKIMSTPEADFDLMCGQNGAGTDPNRAVGFFYSTGAGANVWGYSNERVDELCELGLATTDETLRAEYYTEAQQIIVDESPNLWFANQTTYFFAGADVQGFEPYAANPNDLRYISIGG